MQDSNEVSVCPASEASTTSTRSTRSSRRGSRATSPSAAHAESPPPQRRRVDEPSSPLPLAPTSPSEGLQYQDRSQFSSPQTRGGLETSEIDLSSPLNYATPSSRAVGTPHGSVYPFLMELFSVEVINTYYILRKLISF